ncbi:MAG: hypothetical protein GOMPHAMPRED_004691 [Gomphillus americanus]|uniref:Uncharacterized protein n=1 Tax=Gomphillus americanus TaxID=1940652 RepID=A0A8H3I7P7_9LECA|nr:MAG: hypothetical protein GOMPHAMPRED_004691 [Gomphillus americanus]
MTLQNRSVLHTSHEKDVQEASAKDATETTLFFLAYFQLPTKYTRQCNDKDVCQDAVDSTREPESSQIDAGAIGRAVPYLWYRVTLDNSAGDTSYTIASDYAHHRQIAVAKRLVSSRKDTEIEEAKREFATADDDLVNDLKCPEQLSPVSLF